MTLTEEELEFIRERASKHSGCSCDLAYEVRKLLLDGKQLRESNTKNIAAGLAYAERALLAVVDLAKMREERDEAISTLAGLNELRLTEEDKALLHGIQYMLARHITSEAEAATALIDRLLGKHAHQG